MLGSAIGSCGCCHVAAAGSAYGSRIGRWIGLRRSGERMPDSTLSNAVNSARSITTPMTTGWPASTGVAPDQPALHRLNPVSPARLRVMDVRRSVGQTIAQQAAAELAAAGQRAAAHTTTHPLTPPPAQPPARHSTETMPKASDTQPTVGARDLWADADEPAFAEWSTVHQAVDQHPRHVAAGSSAGRPATDASSVERAAGQVGGGLQAGAVREMAGTVRRPGRALWMRLRKWTPWRTPPGR
ncbi:hypothetical protein EV652_107556 [Kribbella steppae]|uniref:Uncharacterized protein n=1 Tax=Kribbella steppae TaxID=2512223 RepID=A0A4R2HIA5_9ACTN|nr:hypothetical protein EV652_107556 [Kribbella steppae]